MSNLMNRRLLRAKRRITDSVDTNVENKNLEQPVYCGYKRKYEPVTPSKSKIQIKDQIETNCITEGILTTPSPKFSANDRLKKYRTSLSDRKNEVIKVHQVLNTSTSELNKSKNNTNINKSFGRSSKTSDILGKRAFRKDIDNEQSDSEFHKKRSKSGVVDIGSMKMLSDKSANDKPFIFQENCDMDWSPIDQEQVVSNIQKYRDSYKEKSYLLPDAIPQSTKANTTITSDAHVEKTLYVVVDTNIFISHLNLVQGLLSGDYNGRQPIVYVPWMVIQELDYFKDGRSDSSAMLRASNKAIKFINKHLMNKHARLQGQTVQQALYQRESSSNADDNILFCCIQLKNTSKTVMLLSNDTNLRNKALINNINAYGPKEIVKEIKGSCLDINDEKKYKIQKISSLLANMCTTIIIQEMGDAYGSVLDQFISKPPWDLKQCLVYIKRFWGPVFSLVITQKQCIKNIDDFLKFIQTCKDLSAHMEEFVKLCFSLCVYFKNCNKFQKEVITCINSIQNVLQ